VLYEMITSHAPFKGQTTSDTSAAILKTEPPAVSRYAPDTPAELDRIVNKTLQKDREERYQVIKDLLLDLKSLKRDLEVNAAVQRSGGSRSQESGLTEAAQNTTGSAAYISTQASLRPVLTSHARWLWPAAMLLISFLIAGGWYWWPQPQETDGNQFGSLLVAQLVSRKNDLNETAADHARFSPDGKFVAYASTKDGSSTIWLKPMGSGEAFTNRSEQGAASPIWSPDGLWIAFLWKRDAQPGIWTMPAFGGSPTLVKLLESSSRELIAWSKNGRIYFEA
jgi:serine/threonine protein kinase